MWKTAKKANGGQSPMLSPRSTTRSPSPTQPPSPSSPPSSAPAFPAPSSAPSSSAPSSSAPAPSSSPSSAPPVETPSQPVATSPQAGATKGAWPAALPRTKSAAWPTSRTSLQLANNNLDLDSQSLKCLIRVQNIVRAWLAAKSLRKKVRTHLFRTKVAFEILSTEQAYLKDLIVVVNEFYMPMASQFPPEQVSVLFANIKDIIGVHTAFIGMVESRLKKWGYNACIASEFLLTVDSFSCYEKYINNFTHAMDYLKEHSANQSAVHKLLEHRSTRKACRGLGLNAFLIMPIQRLPRFVLLLKELIRYTPEGHPDRKNADEALEKMQKLTERLNRSKRDAENKDKIDSITRTVSGLNFELATREFLHEGTLEEVVKNNTSIRTILTSSSSGTVIMDRVGYYVFMFNDVLLCAKRLSAPAAFLYQIARKATYQFSSPSIIPLQPGSKASVDTTVDYGFKIEFTDPDDETKTDHRVFVAATGKERDDWIKKINSRK